jgi:hypothetical protein
MANKVPLIFSFPSDSTSTTKVLPAVGVHEFNFVSRGVLYSDGSGDQMGSGLQNTAYQSIESFTIYSSQNIKIQLISTVPGHERQSDWIEVAAKSRRTLNGVMFDIMRLSSFVAGTQIAIVASTLPDTQFSAFMESISVVNPAYVIASVPTVDFLAGLALNASANANLVGLTDNTVTITGLTVVSAQNLHYQIMLYKKDTFLPADFAGSIDADLASYGVAVGAVYVMDITKEDDLYIDVDSTQELHVALVNRSVGAKNAGAAGAVTLTFKYEPRRA